MHTCVAHSLPWDSPQFFRVKADSEARASSEQIILPLMCSEGVSVPGEGVKVGVVCSDF